MAYRVTKKAAAVRRKMAAMREAKECRRLERGESERQRELPDLRRIVFVVDFDFGMTIHWIDLHKTDRIDCYRVVVDGKEWKRRIGWSGVLAGLRKSLPRVAAM